MPTKASTDSRDRSFTVADDAGFRIPTEIENADVAMLPSGQVKKELAKNTDSDATVVIDVPVLKAEHWDQILPKLRLSGVTLSLASNCVMQQATTNSCQLLLKEGQASLWNNTHEARIKAALVQLFERDIDVTVIIGETGIETPAEVKSRKKDEAHAEAVSIIENDKNVLQLIDFFDGKLEMDTIAANQQLGD